jgi:hypothetical protein
MKTIESGLLFLGISLLAVAGPVPPDADGVLYLKPDAAEISGTPLKVERKGHRPRNLGYWVDASNTATWTITLAEAGNYAPSITFSCANVSAGAVVAIVSGEKELARFTVTGTGTFTDFRVLDLEPFALPAGESKLTLRPVEKPAAAVMDVRLITLTPAS